MAAIRYCPRRSAFGFPQRCLVDPNEAKIPALKRQDDEEEEKEEAMEVDVKKPRSTSHQGQRTDVTRTEDYQKVRGSMSWFLGNFDIKVKKDENLKERLKEARERSEKEMEREIREQEELLRLEREEQARMEEEQYKKEEEKRKKDEEVDKILQRIQEKKEVEARRQEEALRIEKEMAEQEELARAAQQAMMFDYTSQADSQPSVMTQNRPNVPTATTKPILVAKVDKSTKQKLIEKNSLSMLLHQIASGESVNDNGDDDDDDEDEDEDDKQKEVDAPDVKSQKDASVHRELKKADDKESSCSEGQKMETTKQEKTLTKADSSKADETKSEKLKKDMDNVPDKKVKEVKNVKAQGKVAGNSESPNVARKRSAAKSPATADKRSKPSIHSSNKQK